MKKSVYVLVGVLVAFLLLPGWSICAEKKAQKALPQVPITYKGDTDSSIIRRAQLIEGAKKEGALSWWTSLKPDQLQVLVAEFNKIYPFIKVTYWRGQDQERDTRLETEHTTNKLTVDLCDAGDFVAYPRRRAMGLTDKYTDFIPGIKTMDKRMFSKFGDWAQLGNNAIVPMYNTNQVSAAEAPKNWEDLLNPKWKGKIGMTTDVKAWYVMALAEGGWGIGKTENFLKSLKQQEPLWAAGHTAGYNLLIAGEYKMMGENYLRYIFDNKKKDVPVDWVRVRPVPITGGTFLLTKKGPNPNSARLFVEWIFSKETAPLYEKLTGYGAAAPGTGTVLSKALEGLPLVYRTEDVVMKTAELKLDSKLAGVLGVTPE
jgi:iron(III) transport system substrate-binding protein